MLKIRLRRTGKRNQAHYRVVVAEHTAPIKGKFVAIVGHYNPRSKELVLKAEEVLRWMDQGAQPSNTVARLLEKQGMKHKQIQIHTFAKRGPKKAVPEAEAPAKTEEPAAEAGETAPEEAAAETSETPAEEPAESKEEAVEKPSEEAPSEEKSA